MAREIQLTLKMKTSSARLVHSEFPNLTMKCGGVPRGFTMIAFTDTGSGSELFAKQFVSPAEKQKIRFTFRPMKAAEIVRIFQNMIGHWT